MCGVALFWVFPYAPIRSARSVSATIMITFLWGGLSISEIEEKEQAHNKNNIYIYHQQLKEFIWSTITNPFFVTYDESYYIVKYMYLSFPIFLFLDLACWHHVSEVNHNLKDTQDKDLRSVQQTMETGIVLRSEQPK